MVVIDLFVFVRFRDAAWVSRRDDGWRLIFFPWEEITKDKEMEIGREMT